MRCVQRQECFPQEWSAPQCMGCVSCAACLPTRSVQQGAVVDIYENGATPLTHSLSRRQALIAATAGIGVAATGAVSIRAQGATPMATPVTTDEFAYLFVQAGFTSG